MRKEIPYLHYVRALACLMVVMLHCLKKGDLNLIENYFYTGVVLFTRPCVPLFFIVSGVLLLPYRSDSMSQFYKKRLPRIALPLLFWGVVYALLPYLIGIENKSEMLHHLMLVPLTYPPQIGGILWFMYIILGIYLIIPFINPKIFESKRAVGLYLLLWIGASIVMLINCYQPLVLGMTPFCDISMLVYFSGYLGYLFLGKYIDKYTEKSYLLRNSKLVICVLPVLYILGMFIIKIFRDSTNSNIMGGFLSLPAILMSGVLFLFIKMIISKFKPCCYGLIRKISKLSYGIYLSHMVIYTLITKHLYMGGGIVWDQIIVMILTFLLALILSFILSKLPFSKVTVGL